MNLEKDMFALSKKENNPMTKTKRIKEIFTSDEIKEIKQILQKEINKNVINWLDGTKKQTMIEYNESLEKLNDPNSLSNIYVILRDNNSKLKTKLEFIYE